MRAQRGSLSCLHPERETRGLTCSSRGDVQPPGKVAALSSPVLGVSAALPWAQPPGPALPVLAQQGCSEPSSAAPVPASEVPGFLGLRRTFPAPLRRSRKGSLRHKCRKSTCPHPEGGLQKSCSGAEWAWAGRGLPAPCLGAHEDLWRGGHLISSTIPATLLPEGCLGRATATSGYQPVPWWGWGPQGGL